MCAAEARIRPRALTHRGKREVQLLRAPELAQVGDNLDTGVGERRRESAVGLYDRHLQPTRVEIKHQIHEKKHSLTHPAKHRRRTLTCVAMPPPVYAGSAVPSTPSSANDCFVHFPTLNMPPLSAVQPASSRKVTVSPSSNPCGFSKSCARATARAR